MTYTLTDAKGQVITKGIETGLSAYNVVASPYATLTAQQDADKRAAQDIADRIRTDLAVYFAKREPARRRCAEMIVKSSDADRYAANPPKDLVAALVFGPDTGPGARARRDADEDRRRRPERRRSASPISTIRRSPSDPARLSDEAAAISMLGGRRVVRVRGAGNASPSCSMRSSTIPPAMRWSWSRAAISPRARACARCSRRPTTPPPSPAIPTPRATCSTWCATRLKAEGLSIAPDALDDAVVAARLRPRRDAARDSRSSRSTRRATSRSRIDDVRAVMGDEAEARVEEALDAAGQGDLPRLDLALERLWIAGTSPVAGAAPGDVAFPARARQPPSRASAASRSTARCASCARRCISARAASFKNQVQRWNESRLGEVLDLLLEAEALTKTTAVPAEAVCARTLFSVAAMATR